MKKWLGILALCLIVYAAFQNVEKPNDAARSDTAPTIVAQPAVPKPAPARVDKSPDAQQRRKVLIEKLISTKIFLKTEVPGSLPRVWVAPAFYELDFDTKQKFVSVVYAYYFDGSNTTDIVRVFDSRTNKSIGSFTLSGLALD